MFNGSMIKVNLHVRFLPSRFALQLLRAIVCAISLSYFAMRFKFAVFACDFEHATLPYCLTKQCLLYKFVVPFCLQFNGMMHHHFNHTFSPCNFAMQFHSDI